MKTLLKRLNALEHRSKRTQLLFTLLLILGISLIFGAAVGWGVKTIASYTAQKEEQALRAKENA